MGAQGSASNGQARAPATTPVELTPALGSTLLRVAWLAILLGLVMELLLVLAPSFGGGMGGLGPFVADLVKHVSWSVFVCVGLAVGTAVIQSRVPVMGFLGLISAPLAFGLRDLARAPQGHARSLGDQRRRGRGPFPVGGRPHQRTRIRVSGAGDRLGEPASVGRRAGTPGGGALGRLRVWGERDSLRDGRNISAVY